ncbi:MAG: hypothetical protein WCK89_25375 [bacterium]
MTVHECRQERRISDNEQVCDRVEKEIYVGREGRQPVLVRVDRCERIVNTLAYVCTAILVSTLLAAGSLLFKTVAAQRTVAAAQVRNALGH